MKTRGITEGAMFCALAVILALLSYFIPFLMILTFFIPVPMVVLGKRQGLKVSVIASFAAIIIIGFFLGPYSAVSIGCLLIFVGCGLGYTYNKNLNPMIKIVVGYLGFALIVVLTIVASRFLLGMDFITEMFVILETSTQEVMDIYQKLGLKAEDIVATQELMKTQIENMKMVLPTAMLMLPLLFSYSNVIICDNILRRLNYEVNPIKPIGKWRMPDSLKYFLLIFVLGFLVIGFLKIEVIPAIYVSNIMGIVYFIYLIMGISVVFDFMEAKMANNKWTKYMIVFLGLLLGLQFIFIVLGIVDTYMDVRKFIPREETKDDGK
ncbi:MAG: YybS family protein [Eubacteriaceae bacterium]